MMTQATPAMRCHWLRIDGGLLLIPGCYSAMLGDEADCVCLYEEDELVVPVQRAAKCLAVALDVPGAAAALALVQDAEDRIRLSVLLRPLRAALDRARAEHEVALTRWRADRTSSPSARSDAYHEIVELPWRVVGQIERAADRLRELAIEPRGTVAQRARRHPEPPSRELLRLLAENQNCTDKEDRC